MQAEPGARRLSEEIRVCPLCDARNPRGASHCANCGTSLADLGQRRSPAAYRAAPAYDYRRGELDLAEASLGRRGRLWSFALGGALIVIIAGVMILALNSRSMEADSRAQPQPPTRMPTRQAGPTVTPGPPTASQTPSPAPTDTPRPVATAAPCVRQVAAGDSLIAILARCGHRDLYILPTVMALNRIADESRIQVGQEIIVPPPSPTHDPAATATDPPAEAASDAEAAETEEFALLSFDPFAPTLTPTLLPGLMWHEVQPDENMIAIALRYKSDAKALSDINPEIEFLLCEFGERFGGPECTVQLMQGQRLRVPAPTPTITPVPTASGSETPTPLPTATFNAPIARSPADQAFFAPGQTVTLRWVGTGRLASAEAYRVQVADLDAQESYEALTRELYFIVPLEWRANDGSSHRYRWHVSVIDRATGAAAHETEPRSFIWQGREA